MNKKKIIIIATSIIVLVAVVFIFVFSGSEETIVNANDILGKIEEKQKLELTNEMLNEIKEDINGEHYELITLTVLQKFYPLEDYDYTKFEITNKKQTDDYTYKVYGKVYYEDNYGGRYYETMDIVYTAEEDTEETKGYSLDIDYEFSK